MNSLKSIQRWFRSRGRTRTLKRAIDEELQFHIDQRTAAHIAAGMPPGAAARAARKQFGNLQRVRGAVTEVDPSQPLYNVMTMARRLNMALLGGFAALALLLAVVGIYGVMSFAVMQRRREIGVRMALGARRCDVLGLIIRGGLRLTLLGVALGLVGALALTRYLSSQLYSVKATGPWTFLGVAVLLTGAALLACWLPARRAAKVEPMEALRSE